MQLVRSYTELNEPLEHLLRRCILKSKYGVPESRVFFLNKLNKFE